jgi:hypothetical protein
MKITFFMLKLLLAIEGKASNRYIEKRNTKREKSEAAILAVLAE